MPQTRRQYRTQDIAMATLLVVISAALTMQLPLVLRAQEQTDRISEASDLEAYRQGFDGLDHSLVYFEEDTTVPHAAHEEVPVHEPESVADDLQSMEERPIDPALLL